MSNMTYFFGTDDNFLNSRATAEELLTEMARARYKDSRGRPGRIDPVALALRMFQRR